MGLFDKLKNVFIEEDFEEDVPVVKTEEKKIETEVVEPVEEKKVEIPLRDSNLDMELSDTKEKFKFPIIFEDDDFEEEKKKTKSINVLERENTKYEPERREIKKEKKSFKPSPVISPVYGVLDKNYSKEDITTKDGLLNDPDKVDIDYVIKKASGEYTTREEKNKTEEAIDLFKETEIAVESVEVPEEEISLDEKIKSIDELLKDTTDDDFYSLVDSMYKDEDKGDDIE